MKTYLNKLPLLVFFATFFASAQCDRVETLVFCDMTTIDGNSDGTPDGVINLYDEYTSQIGGVLAAGTWFDPGFNFALDGATGDLHLWDLDNSSVAVTDYQFELTNPNCTTGPTMTLNVVLGPFPGNVAPPIGTTGVNIQVCDIGPDPCGSIAEFDMDLAFLSLPSPHTNGLWEYRGSSANFISIDAATGVFRAAVPYTPGPPLVDEETFELFYVVPGIAPCTSQESSVKISVIREVHSGFANEINICENNLVAGSIYENIDLLNDNYLVNEDIEGGWLDGVDDPTGQISGPGDSIINLVQVYNDLVATNPRFGCETYEYTYMVSSRSTVCEDKESTVRFTFHEELRPFSQTVPNPQFCVNDNTVPATINLYDYLEFTAGFEYPNDCCTDWTLVSGPSNLGLESNPGTCTPGNPPIPYNHLGTISLTNLTNADAGTYVFEYMVPPEVNCNCEATSQTIYESPDGCNADTNEDGLCGAETAQVTIIINPFNYAGEHTPSDPTQVVEYCETSLPSPVDLITLLEDDGGVSGPIYNGALGTWTDINTGLTITNPYTFPVINGNTVFNFNYSTTTPSNCTDSANLTITVYEEYSAGMDTTRDVCVSDSSFNLFDELGGTPNNNGTWTFPDGTISTDNNVTFDPSASDAGVYTYTVPDNVSTTDPTVIMCAGSSSTFTVTIFPNSNAGMDMSATACRSDLQYDLATLLDPVADAGGVYVDVSVPPTGALSGSIIDLTLLAPGDYDFEYQIQLNSACPQQIATLQITVTDLVAPTVNNLAFCVLEEATLANLTVNGATDYEWYDTATSTTPLDLDTLLVNGEDYYIASTDPSATCFSTRTTIIANVIPYGVGSCVLEISDGVSPNNDSQNDNLDLGVLPQVYPNYEIKIFNRYGSVVFVGNVNTGFFEGKSNVSLALGENLPSGTYFYVFDPKDNITKPFQSNFYLSR